jgi:hypothetical protein
MGAAGTRSYRRNRRLSDEERAERVEQLNTQLTEAIASLTSSDGWMRMLATAAKFHRYSANSVFLLSLQAYERGTVLTRLASFRRECRAGRSSEKASVL